MHYYEQTSRARAVNAADTQGYRTWQAAATGLNVIRPVLLTKSILCLAELSSDDFAWRVS